MSPSAPGASQTANFTVPAGLPTGTNSMAVIASGISSAPPTVISFTPTTGGAGTEVVITGTNLTGAFTVAFAGGKTASAANVTAQSATVVVPAGAQTGVFTVKTNAGTAASPGPFKVIPLPSISSFTPAYVVAGSGSTTITATGTNLAGVTSFTWNGHSLTALSSSGSGSISGTIAAAYLKSAASTPIVVVSPGGTAKRAKVFTGS